MPRLISGLMAGLIAIAATVAMAQGTSINLGSLEHDTSLPVEVSSNSLSIANENGRAVFDGDVVVIQGPMRLGAGRIEIDYGQAVDGGTTDIREMHATGGVTYTNGTDAAESREAIYSPEEGALVMTGDVILTQGPGVISGDRLVVDLAAGTGVMEGRVRTVFQTDNN